MATVASVMASTPPHPAASTDSLASSGGSGSGSGSQSRFNRLIHRLHGSNSSRDLSNTMDDNPSTPLRYAPRSGTSAAAATSTGMANSPALSDIDDIPLERPVFESKFMRELQQGQPSVLSPSNAHARPPLAPSYSSPAAVIGHSPPNNNNSDGSNGASHHHRISPSSRELERTRSSPIATSPSSSNSSASLKSRLVRVASSNSLFGKSNATSIGPASSTTTNETGNTSAQSHSPSHLHLNHRKTASLVSSSTSGPSPSPRSRLAASVASSTFQQQQQQGRQNSSPVPSTSASAFSKSHAYRHSEDVRQYSRSSPSLEVPSSAYGKNHASSPPLSSSPVSSSLMSGRAVSPNLHALREQSNEDGPQQQVDTASRTAGGLFSGLSVSSFSLSRKRSVDGLSLASNLSSHHLPIPEGEEGQQDGHREEEDRPSPRAESRASHHLHHDEAVDEDQTAKRNSGGSVEQKQKQSSSSAHPGEIVSRPPLGERYLSSDRLPLQDGANNTVSATLKSTTPGFPRHMPNASYSSTYTGPSSAYSSAPTDGTNPIATTTIQSQRTGLISSGLSESSRRFRSAFRLNKSRAAGMATPGGGTGGNEAAASLMGASTTTRRAMRVPLRQQQLGNEDEEEEQGTDEASAAGVSVANSTTSPKMGEEGESASNTRNEAFSPTLTKTPNDLVGHHDSTHDKHPTPPTGPHISHVLPHDSGNASRSRSTSPRVDSVHHDEELEQRERERESARERAQLILPSTATHHHQSSHSLSSLPPHPHKIVSTRPVKVHTLGGDGVQSANGALRPGRALRGEQQDQIADDEASPEIGRSASASSGANTTSQARHARTASHGRLEDLVLVQEAGNLAHARPASRQQTHAHVGPSSSSSSLASHHRIPSDSTLVGNTAPAPVESQRERPWQVQPQQREVPHAQMNTRDRHVQLHHQQQEQEEVLLIDGDKENAVAGDWYRQHREKREDKEQSEKGQHLPSQNGPRQILGQVRKPLQEQQANQSTALIAPSGGFLPEPRQQGPLPQQHRVGAKLSSSSSNGGLGYFPSDRQVIVNDYAVPTKRSGDTPPSSNEKAQFQPFPKQQQSVESHSQYPYQQQQQQHSRVAPPPSRPPAASLPALPSLPSHAHGNEQQAHPQASTSVQKRAPGTVTVQGKTYTRMGLLGRGGSSKVFRVCDKDHLVYALKKIDLGRGADSETYQAFLNEISLLEALRGHDRIIQLVAHEVNEAKKSLIMVMEIGEIDLNALLQERISKSFPASMNFIRYMWEQMLEAVNVIHDEGIVHTDLKPANFVLVKGALKLIDFGIAKAIPNDTTNIARDQQIGTANYMSPEALNPHNSTKNGRVMKLGRPSDVWSLGCILYQMVYGHTPFGQIKNLAAKMNAIQTPGYAINFPTHAVPSTIKGEPLPDLAVRVEDDLLAVMKSCLRYEPKKRATIPELLMDPFLRREGSGNSREGHDGSPSRANGQEQHVSLDLVSAIVKQTLNWSNGRQPTRGEQERFVEAILRQANGIIR